MRAVAVIMLTCCTASPPTATPPPRLFTFHVGFWTNLHQFAYVVGRARNHSFDAHRRAVVGAIAEDAEPHAPAWDALVEQYRATWSNEDAIHDGDLAGATERIAMVPDDATPADLADAPSLTAAAEAYRRTWWPRHEATDRARIAELEPLLARYGPDIAQQLERIYGVRWPEAGYTVEVSGYASWAGAYSMRDDFIALSGTDPGYTGDMGLECVFHEALHHLSDGIDARIDADATRFGVLTPAQLSHSLIFYTAAYAVRRVIPDHRGYAEVNGVWARGLVPEWILDATWLPYLDGFGDLDGAVAAVVLAASAPMPH